MLRATGHGSNHLKYINPLNSHPPPHHTDGDPEPQTLAPFQDHAASKGLEWDLNPENVAPVSVGDVLIKPLYLLPSTLFQLILTDIQPGLVSARDEEIQTQRG